MTDVTSPYINTEYHRKVNLLPYQMNNDVYKYLKINLKKDIEKKCIKYGYVVKIFKITDYSEGINEPENFSSSAVYNVKFSCRMCIPSVQTKLICVVSNTVKGLIVAENGPILIIIAKKNVNMANFTVGQNNSLQYKKDNKIETLKKNDIIKVSVLAQKYYKSDSNIQVYGFLENIASKDEKEQYYNDLYFRDEYDDDFIETKNKNNDDEDEDEEIYEQEFETLDIQNIDNEKENKDEFI